MGAAAEWVTSGPVAPPAAVLGGRQQWLDYSFETTGFGSVERGGGSAHRVTIVHPADAEALRRHHRLVRSGRLHPLVPRRSHRQTPPHVLDRGALVHSRADDRGSWLAAALAVAQWCGCDDEVAAAAGATLRHVLWTGRHDLAHPDVVGALVDLRHAAHDLADQRRLLQRSIWRGDVDAVRFEARVLAETRRELDGLSSAS